MRTRTPDPIRRKRHLLITLASVLALLLIVHVVVPPLILHYVNDRLSRMGDYSGRVADVDLALWHGGFEVESLRIWKRGKDPDKPLLHVPRSRVEWLWDDLFHGRLRVEVTAWAPKVRLVHTPARKETGAKLPYDLRLAFGNKVKSMTVFDGDVQIDTRLGDEKVRLAVRDLQASLHGLSTEATRQEPRPGRLRASGRLSPPGSFRMTSRFDPVQPGMHFKTDARLRAYELDRWNPLLARADSDLRLQQGRASLELDLSGRRGTVNGEARVYLRDVVVKTADGKAGSLLTRLKAEVANVAMELLENEKGQVVAARVPIRGRIDDPEMAAWPTLWSALRHAFAQTLAGRGEALKVTPGAARSEPPPQGTERTPEDEGEGDPPESRKAK